MTLEEIEKVIDEADVVYLKEPNYSQIAFLSTKGLEKESVKLLVNKDYVLTYYKLNKETGEMTLLAKVDHIDKEKKIIKKRLGEMSDEEIKELKKKFCQETYAECKICPFAIEGARWCLSEFSFWKSHYFSYKYKEFEVEVEE